jgi:predicted RNA-binding Zn-ribbon protein involved in translation (DUF1610 family)
MSSDDNPIIVPRCPDCGSLELLQNVQVEGTREVEWEYSKGRWVVTDVFSELEVTEDELHPTSSQFHCPNCGSDSNSREIEHFYVCNDCQDRTDDSSTLRLDGIYRCDSCQSVHASNSDNVPEEAPPTQFGACDNCGMSQKPVCTYTDETLCPECAVSRGCVQM